MDTGGAFIGQLEPTGKSEKTARIRIIPAGIEDHCIMEFKIFNIPEIFRFIKMTYRSKVKRMTFITCDERCLTNIEKTDNIFVKRNNFHCDQIQEKNFINQGDNVIIER